MAHDQYTHRILTQIEADNRVSKRSLSRDLGIALGLTNPLVWCLVHKGWVRIMQIKPNRMQFLLTPAGIAEKARMSRAALDDSIRFYVEARERFATLFRELAGDSHESGDGPATKHILSYGVG